MITRAELYAFVLAALGLLLVFLVILPLADSLAERCAELHDTNSPDWRACMDTK